MHHDHLLFASGVIRALIWFFGFVAAARFKRWMVAAGFLIGSVNSFVFAFSNAHYAVRPWLLNLIAYGSALSASLIVSGFILGTILYSSDKGWTP